MIKYRVARVIVFLPLIEILTKIINHTNKETDLDISIRGKNTIPVGRVFHN
jgi:hypothetical protein